MKYVAWIFARGGSKGLPKKNIKLLMGKPLIGWSIEQARSSGCFDRIMVSTDDSEIAEIAESFGAEVPFMRPARLAEDTSPEWLAWQHAAEWQRHNLPDVKGFVSIPPTAPLRHTDDISSAIHQKNSDLNLDLVLGITPSQHHPSFNMVVKNGSRIGLMAPNAEAIHRRQDTEAAYNITTVVYVTTVKHIMSSSNVMDGEIGAIVIPGERAVDIDTPLDFEWIEFLMERT